MYVFLVILTAESCQSFVFTSKKLFGEVSKQFLQVFQVFCKFCDSVNHSETVSELTKVFHEAQTTTRCM